MRLESRFRLSGGNRGELLDRLQLQNLLVLVLVKWVRTKQQCLPTLVKVQLFVGRAVSETFDVHQVAVDVRVVQSAERDVCRRKRRVMRKRRRMMKSCQSRSSLTGCLLLFNGRG